MILPIEKELRQTEVNQMLRKKAAEVPISDILKPEMQKLIDNMIETMYHANGIGIAAPQIGISKQIIIVETNEGPLTLINPKLVRHSLRKVGSEEGCLSMPGLYGTIKRWRTVNVKAFNRHAKEILLAPNDFTNIILQHEIDHLNGILFADRLPKGAALHPHDKTKQSSR